MPATKQRTLKCSVCHREYGSSKCTSISMIRPALTDFILTRHPDIHVEEGVICRSCLGDERTAYVLDQLKQERGELSRLETEVSQKAVKHVAITEHLEEQFSQGLTYGQHLADRVATIGGSWPFVIGFALALAIWIAWNSLILKNSAFDPFPYILLNLALSTLAAIQAPIIMMSQNRAAARDRMEADEDFKVNLKSELEIAALHDKLDHMLHVQWERMAEIQQMQLDLLDQLAKR